MRTPLSHHSMRPAGHPLLYSASFLSPSGPPSLPHSPSQHHPYPGTSHLILSSLFPVGAWRPSPPRSLPGLRRGPQPPSCSLWAESRVPRLLSRRLEDPAGPKSPRPAAPVPAGGGHSPPAGQTPSSGCRSTRSSRRHTHCPATRRPAPAGALLGQARSAGLAAWCRSLCGSRQTPRPLLALSSCRARRLSAGRRLRGPCRARSPVRLRGGSAAARQGDYTSRRALSPEEGPALAPPRKIRRLAGTRFLFR